MVEKEKGICKDCVNSYKVGMVLSNYFCTLFSDKSGDDVSVNPYATCNYFRKRITMKDSGYTGGSSGCFLTSACVDYLGKEDDCFELTTLREFRDNKMSITKSGVQLINEYYNIAPKIVELIDKSPIKDVYYKYIYGEIQRCLDFISKGQDDKTIETYKQMVLKLKNDFSL